MRPMGIAFKTLRSGDTIVHHANGKEWKIDRFTDRQGRTIETAPSFKDLVVLCDRDGYLKTLTTGSLYALYSIPGSEQEVVRTVRTVHRGGAQ